MSYSHLITEAVLAGAKFFEVALRDLLSALRFNPTMSSIQWSLEQRLYRELMKRRVTAIQAPTIVEFENDLAHWLSV